MQEFSASKLFQKVKFAEGADVTIPIAATAMILTPGGYPRIAKGEFVNVPMIELIETSISPELSFCYLSTLIERNCLMLLKSAAESNPKSEDRAVCESVFYSDKEILVHNPKNTLMMAVSQEPAVRLTPSGYFLASVKLGIAIINTNDVSYFLKA